MVYYSGIEPRSVQTTLAGIPVSKVCFGTEHINRTVPEFGGMLLAAAACRHNVFFWDTDNAYGSHTQVAAALKQWPRSKAVICSKTYGRSREEAAYDFERTLKELDTPYLDICLPHEVAAGTLSEKMPALQYLLEQKAAGRIRAVGLSSHCAPVISAAADTPGIEIVCAPFNREGSRIEQGSLADMEAALRKAHRSGLGVYVIKVIGKGELHYDVAGALEWVLRHRDFIDVYNIGVANLSELRENLELINSINEALDAALPETADANAVALHLSAKNQEKEKCFYVR